MKTRTPLVLLLSLTCLLPLLCVQVSACSCGRLSPCESFGWADAVFVGRMLGGTIKTRERVVNGVTISYEAGEATLAVEEGFKGTAGGEVKVNIYTERGTSCEWAGLEKGARYLVYADREANHLVIWACNPTKKVERAQDDLTFLHNLPAIGSGGRVSGQVGLDSGQRPLLPLVGMTIAIQDEKGQRWETLTNSAGAFEFIGLKSGKYIVEPIGGDAYSVYEPTLEAIVADRGCVTANFWAERATK